MARVLGIDISDNVVRAALLRSSLKNIHVLRYIEIPYDPSGNAAFGPTSPTDALRLAMQSVGTPPDSVVVATDGRTSSIRTVSLPAAARKRIHHVLPFELETEIPFDLEEVIIDHQIIARQKDSIELLAAVVPKQIVTHLLQTCREADVQPRQVSVGAASLEGLTRVTTQLGGEPTCWVVNLGTHCIDICALDRGRCVWARTLSVGAWPWPAAAPKIHIAMVQSTTAYRAAGLPLPAHVYLIGEHAHHSELRLKLQACTFENVPITALDLPPAATGTPGEPISAFGRALGLAGLGLGHGKRINLRQGEFATRQAVGLLRTHAVLLSSCAAAILVALGFSMYTRSHSLQNAQLALRQRIAVLSRQVLGEEVSDLEELKKIIAADNGEDDPLPRKDAFDVLDALSKAIAPDITHNTRLLVIDLGSEGGLGRLQLEGTVPSVSKRDAIASALQEQACITNLDKGRVTPGVEANQVNYELSAELTCGNVAKKPKQGESNADSPP
jgi:general secretion pathway protein L